MALTRVHGKPEFWLVKLSTRKPLTAGCCIFIITPNSSDTFFCLHVGMISLLSNASRLVDRSLFLLKSSALKVFTFFDPMLFQR